MSDAMLTIRSLAKSYGDKQVLRGLDLDIAPGELLGLIGPNGAGKSTLLRTLIGLVQRTGGTMQVLGHDPAKPSASLAIRRRCSYLPGETGVYQQMTGQSFLRFAHGFYPELQLDLRERLLEQFALPLKKRVRSYSAGMKQKLALVATLVPDVELYLLDEPDRALDASVRFYLRDVLRDLKQAGKTILLSSHHLSEVETLADRLVFLLNGALVPQQRVQAARATLRRQPRVRLAAAAAASSSEAASQALPSGARILRAEPDGMVVVETDGDAMEWLKRAEAGAIASVEIGVDRLEDLYQLLLTDSEAQS
ncbi:MAG: ABC transporter ATP-binding protein [Planctomycetota bacterium]